MGAVGMLMQVGAATTLKFCPPANATVYQGVRVVLKFMDATPERLNEQSPASVAMRALEEDVLHVAGVPVLRRNV